MNKVYQIITDQIISKLEEGVIPWHKPWTGGPEGRPKNLTTGKAYRGFNSFWLGLLGGGSPYWLTIKQANALGGKVKKGSQTTIVIYWNKN
jgi:antirestriction protein ArdC